MATLSGLVFMVSFFLSHTDVCLTWPEGQYGLPMTKSGCPVHQNFVWLSGSRTHQTEAGSFMSDDNHFAGTPSTSAYPTDRITQYFCIKNSYPRAGNYKWEPGKYCIYKVSDSCPAGFKEGSLYWDDDVDFQYSILEHPVQSTTGSLPRGEYDRNTDIEFCCRTDGRVRKEILLPIEVPFYLLRFGNECQKVKDTSVTEEWIQWSGDHSFDHDSGSHPMHTRTTQYSRVYYCYYEEAKQSSTVKTVIFCILGIVGGIILIVIIMFIVQRCIGMRKLKRAENAERNDNAESMLENDTNKQISAIYKPNRGKKKKGEKAMEEEDGILLTANSRPISQPPSYAEVVRQDSQQSQQNPTV